MANKKNPNLVIDRFQDDLDQTKSDSAKLDILIQSEPIEFRRRMNANFFLYAATAWERFLSEWFVAAINTNPSVARNNLQQKLKKAAKDSGIDQSLLAASLISESHINIATVERFLKVEGYNYTAPELKDFQKDANTWLADPYLSKVSAWTKDDFSPILTTRLLRNALAHDSDQAYKRAARALPNSPFADLRDNQIKNFNRKSIQTYLYKKMGEDTRLVVLLDLLKERAESLRV